MCATQSPAGFEFIHKVEKGYELLTDSAEIDADVCLGGKLFFAGELDEEGRAIIAAANIAGAATLAASADSSVQRQAIRDGIADFLVTTLDEALRILKNELRKRQTVAVCVGVTPEAMECEVQERGVAPDLMRSEVSGRAGGSDWEGARWSVDIAPAQWLPRLDAIAAECLGSDAWRARRWLRLAPRYLGRLAHGVRALRCNRGVAEEFARRIQSSVKRGEIPVEVKMELSFGDEYEAMRFVPTETAGGNQARSSS